MIEPDHTVEKLIHSEYVYISNNNRIVSIYYKNIIVKTYIRNVNIKEIDIYIQKGCIYVNTFTFLQKMYISK